MLQKLIGLQIIHLTCRESGVAEQLGTGLNERFGNHWMMLQILLQNLTVQLESESGAQFHSLKIGYLHKCDNSHPFPSGLSQNLLQIDR